MIVDQPALLLVHPDAEQLAAWTTAFESSGYTVLTAATLLQAQSHLEKPRPIDAIVAQWDPSAPLGGDVYRWALQHRFDMRSQFVFIGDDAPSGFDTLVGGRCLLVSINHGDDVVGAVAAAAGRSGRFKRQTIPPFRAPGPALLLADDDPILLDVIAGLLSKDGFSVTPVDSGRSAIAALGRDEFDLVVVDWHMDQGSGLDVLLHIQEKSPLLVERLVFLANAVTPEMTAQSRGRPIFAKGQDAAGLIALLNHLALDEWG